MGGKIWHVEFVMTTMLHDNSETFSQCQLWGSFNYEVVSEPSCDIVVMTNSIFFFHKSVGFAEIMILSVNIDEKKLINFIRKNTQIQLAFDGKDNCTANY